MMEKGFPTKVFIFVIVLSCSSSCVFSLRIFPRITRTIDATIIDFADEGYAPLIYQGKNLGEIGPEEFIPPLPTTFNPYYSMIYQQQQQTTFYSGWSFFYRQPVNLPLSSVDSPSSRQLDKLWRRKSWEKQAIQCGRGPATMPAKRSLKSERIAAGVDTKKYLWPFMVALKNGDDILFCGGSLINSVKVLFAAQCLEPMSLFDISTVTVLIGMHKSDFSDVQMTRRISKIVLHSRYNAATFANDIAIITLDMPVPLSKTVSPVCLPPASDDPDQHADQDAIILGWGGTGIRRVTGLVDSSGTETVSAGPSAGTVGIAAVSLPGTVNGPAVNSASGISINGPGTGTTIGNVNGTVTLGEPGTGSFSGSAGTGTFTEPISVGVSGANNQPSTGTEAASGPVIGTQTDSVNMPVTSVPVTSSTVGGSSYDGTVVSIGGVTVIRGKIDRPAAKIKRAISLAPPNPILQQAKVAILSNAECRADSVIGQFVSDKTLCISSSDKFTCANDVGGPIVFLSSPGIWTLIGINSYTQDCENNGLKTKVSAYRAWIDLYMS